MSDVPPSYPPPPPPPPPGGYPPGGGYPPPGGGLPPGMPPLAEIGPRVVAFLIDRVAIPFGLYVALFVVGAILGAVSDALATLFLLVGWLAIIGYFVWLVYQEGTTGQSIGKKMQNVRLVGLENGGQPIGFGMAFLRAFINGIPCNLGWIFPFFDAQRQTLGDKVSKSVTVAA